MAGLSGMTEEFSWHILPIFVPPVIDTTETKAKLLVGLAFFISLGLFND